MNTGKRSPESLSTLTRMKRHVLASNCSSQSTVAGCVLVKIGLLVLALFK